MNNKQFIQKLTEATGQSEKETQRLVNQTIEGLTTLLEESAKHLDDGNDVLIHGFGTFEVKYKKERIIVNPSSQKRMLVPPKLSVTFHLSETIKSKIQN